MLLHTGKTYHTNGCNKSAKAFHVAVLPVLQLCLSVPVVMQHMLSRRLSWQRKESTEKQKGRQPRKPDGRPCVTTWSTTSCRSVLFFPCVACRLRLQGSIFDSLFWLFLGCSFDLHLSEAGLGCSPYNITHLLMTIGQHELGTCSRQW